MYEKLQINGFKWVGKSKLLRFNERFIKSYNENSDIGYFLEVEDPKELFNLQKDLPFLPERKKVNECEKLICSIEDKEKYILNKEWKQKMNLKKISLS